MEKFLITGLAFILKDFHKIFQLQRLKDLLPVFFLFKSFFFFLNKVVFVSGFFGLMP